MAGPFGAREDGISIGTARDSPVRYLRSIDW